MIGHRVPPRAFLSLAAALVASLGCAYLAFGATGFTLAALGDGERFALDVTTTNASSVQGSGSSNALLSIVRHGNNLTVQIDRNDTDAQTYAGWWQKDGTLALQLSDKNEPPPLEIRDFNLVAAALVGAPAAPKLNDSWKSNLEVPFAEMQTVRIATQVTVVGLTADTIDLQAIGRGKATLSRGMGARGGRGFALQNPGGGFPGSTFPGRRGRFERGAAPTIDVAVNVDSHFSAGRLLAAKGTIQTTNEGRERPASSVSWTLTPRR